MRSLVTARTVTLFGLIPLVALFGPYLLFFAYPSYVSGIYRFSGEALTERRHDVPIYGDAPFYSDPIPAFALNLFFILILAWLPLLLTTLLPVALRKRAFRRIERFLYPAIALGITTGLLITLPAALTIVFWIVD